MNERKRLLSMMAGELTRLSEHLQLLSDHVSELQEIVTCLAHEVLEEEPETSDGTKQVPPSDTGLLES